jgi:hypothetical protein
MINWRRRRPRVGTGRRIVARVVLRLLQSFVLTLTHRGLPHLAREAITVSRRHKNTTASQTTGPLRQIGRFLGLDPLGASPTYSSAQFPR